MKADEFEKGLTEVKDEYVEEAARVEMQAAPEVKKRSAGRSLKVWWQSQ